MQIGHNLRKFRAEKGLSQGDIEERTGLLRCYISRVENGHTVPSVPTLEKVARALDVPFYQLFYDYQVPSKVNEPRGRVTSEEDRFLTKIQGLTTKMNERDQRLFLGLAQKLANSKARKGR